MMTRLPSRRFFFLLTFACLFGLTVQAHALTWQYHPVGTLNGAWQQAGRHTWESEDCASHLFIQMHLYPDNSMEMHVFIPQDKHPQPAEDARLVFYDLNIFPHNPVREFKLSSIGESDSPLYPNLHWTVFSTQRHDRSKLAHIIRLKTELAWIVFNQHDVYRLYSPATHIPRPAYRHVDEIH